MNKQIFTIHLDEFTLSTDPSLLDVEVIFDFLTHSYWAKGRSRSLIEKAIQHSYCFGMYHQQSQAGFARVVTDFATFAYIADVFILEKYRGKGLGKWLIKSILEAETLADIQKWDLHTRDAHGLYKQFGFAPPKTPETYLVKRPLE